MMPSLFVVKAVVLVAICLSAAIQVTAQYVPQSSAVINISEPEWKAGVHYSILAPQNETLSPKGKIEIREFFVYTNPRCRQFEPQLREWLSSKVKEIVHVRFPALLWPHVHYHARMYYTLIELGREDLHQRFYDWVADEKRYPIYSDHVNPQADAHRRMNIEFAKSNGIGRRKFLAIYDSPRISEIIAKAELSVQKYHIWGTPGIVVNGKYSVSVPRIHRADPNHNNREIGQQDFDKMMQLVEYLIKLELKG